MGVTISEQAFGLQYDTIQPMLVDCFSKTDALFACLHPRAYDLPMPGSSLSFSDYELQLANATRHIPEARNVTMPLASLPSPHSSREQLFTLKQESRDALFAWLAQPDLKDLHHTVLYQLLEQEFLAQEFLLSRIHHLPHTHKRKPVLLPGVSNAPPLPDDAESMVEIPAGVAVLGAMPNADDFRWDSEMPSMRVEVSPFAIDAYPVTNAAFLAFVEDGGYEERRYWTAESWRWKCQRNLTHPALWRQSGSGWRLRGLFQDIPLPLSWPAIVSYPEAAAYARFVGKSLPTESEWQRAAYGQESDEQCALSTAEFGQRHEAEADAVRIAESMGSNASLKDGMLAFPKAVGLLPRTGPFGVYGMVGNGWEWTCTQFGPLPGFQASRKTQSAERAAFDGYHFVVKGGSWVTPSRLLRPSFRHRCHWLDTASYTTFRCVIRR